MKNLIFTTIALLLITHLNAQQFITNERIMEIKTTGNYYWAEKFDPQSTDVASGDALNQLTEQIISDVVSTTTQKAEVLKAIEMGAHLDFVKVRKGVCVLAWISKDSVFITTRRPIQKTDNKPDKPQVEQPSEITDPVVNALVNCKNYREAYQTINKKGIRSAWNSSDGIEHVEQCMIAVFSSDGSLQALLDKGNNSRLDLISHTIIDNPETYYRNKNHNLLYILKK